MAETEIVAGRFEKKRNLLEWAITFWICVGVAYCLMRWVFNTGHLAMAFAWIEAGCGTGLLRIQKRIGA